MKKYLLSAGLLLLPFLVYAAYDDVSLTTDARIGLTGETLSVSGATAYVQSIDVSSDSFIATLVPGSGGSSWLKVSSPSLYKFTHSVTPQSAYVDAEVCNSSESSVTFAPSGGKTIKVTVQLDTASPKCSGGSSGSSSGGGGGGGGGTTAAPPVSPPVTPPALPLGVQPTMLVFTFAKPLAVSQSNSDIMMLQKALNADPETRIAVASSGSPGQETNFFGTLTKTALGKFQLKHGIVKSSQDSGFGIFGPKTRAKMNELLLSGKLSVRSDGVVTQPTDIQARINVIRAEISRLTAIIQQMLAAQGH